MVTNCIVCGKPVVNDPEDPKVCEDCLECPKCGTVGDDVFIDVGISLEDTLVVCTACESSWQPRRYEKALLKKKSLIPCPHCKGCGSVPKEN